MTTLSTQPTAVQISQTVRPMGAITTTPAKKLLRSAPRTRVTSQWRCGGAGRDGRGRRMGLGHLWRASSAF
jgi:hypothetical protein